jgi:hypothetical protein
MNRYSFCETAAAYGSYHIRELTAKGQCLSGGADTQTLCGLPAAWDLKVPLTDSVLRLHGCAWCTMRYRGLLQAE